jgi:glycosyl transferase family 25
MSLPRAIPCFVVNLARDVARRENIEAQLAHLGMAYNIVPAVDGKALSDAELAENYDRAKAEKAHRPLSLSEIGCAMSHLQIYQTVVRGNLPYAFVLEDDALLAANVDEVLARLPRFVFPDEPVVTLLSYVRRYRNRERQILSDSAFLADTYGNAARSLAYVVTQKAAQQLIKHGYPIWRECDRWYDFKREGVVRVKCVVPYCVGNDPQFSSGIEAERKLLMSDSNNKRAEHDGRSFLRKKFEKTREIIRRRVLRLGKQKQTW